MMIWGNRAAFGAAIVALSIGTADVVSQETPEGEQPPVEEAQPDTEPGPAEGEDDAEDPEPETADPAPDPERSVDGPVDPDHADHIAEPDDRYPGCEFDTVAECDLAAQQSMAESTFSMMQAAWLGVFLTFVGVGLIYRTMRYTRDAATYTKVAADASKQAVGAAEKGVIAARTANEITRQAYAVQQRPWLRWHIVQPLKIRRTGDQLTVYMDCIIENIGATPAMRVMYFAEMYCCKKGEAAVDRGREYHREHAQSYPRRQISLADILPGEKHPARLGAHIQIDDLDPNAKGFVSIFMAFHAAFSFFESAKTAEIGTVYMICRKTSGETIQRLNMRDLESDTNAFMEEVWSGRVIT